MEKPLPPDFLGTPGSKDNLNWKMLKEGYLIRHKRGRKTKRRVREVQWFVVRQDTFVQKSRGNWQSVRLEAYSGKTLKHAWALDVSGTPCPTRRLPRTPPNIRVDSQADGPCTPLALCLK